MSEYKRIHVAVGVVINTRKKVLISQRTVQDDYFMQWEFPGGKVEVGESAEQALVRELREEIGIKVCEQKLLLKHSYDYPDKMVNLAVFTVTQYLGEPIGLENQALEWVSPSHLSDVDFLSGNKKIIEAVQALDLSSSR